MKSLLWVDCTAGAIAGVLMLSLSGWLTRLYALPLRLLLLIGAANLLYGACSFTLARRAHRPMSIVLLLVGANAAWSLVCLGLATRYWTQASPFGLAQLVGEAVLVGGLAALEWRHRDLLATEP